jgi:hypothetical protein
MIMQRGFKVALALVALQGHATAQSIGNVTVMGPRIHLGDVVIGLAPEVAETDLGPAPASTGTRVVTRSEMAEALHTHGIEGSTSLPFAVRVHRKLRVLDAGKISEIVTGALGEKLPRGTLLHAVRASGTVRIPDGWTEVRCDLPHPPHKAGPFASAVSLSFFAAGQALWTMSVPVDLLLTQEAESYDVPRGSHVTFVIRRGLVEVSSSGTVTIDADVGSVAPVVVMPSGRSLPARLEDARTAVMVETQ